MAVSFDLGSFIPGAFNSVLGLFSQESQSGLQNMSIQAQKNMMKENNAFQSSENEKARNFTKQMYEQQLADTQSWNDFSSIVQRAMKAGISPSAIFGSGAPQQLGGIMPPTVGHSAVPSGSYGDVINPPNRSAEAFSSIASALASLSQAAKTGVETGHLGSLMSAQMKNYLSQASLNDVRSSSEQFELSLRKIYGSKLYDSELGKNYSQMVNAYHQAMLFAEQGKTEESKRELNLAERLYKDSLRASTDAQAEKTRLETSWYPAYMRAYIGNLNASSEESRASAAEHNASAEQVQIFNKIYSDKRYAHSLITEAVERGRQAVGQTKITKSQAEQMTYMVEQAAYANDMKEFTFWSNQINQFVGTLGDAATSIYGAGALKALTQLRQGQLQSPPPVRGFAP